MRLHGAPRSSAALLPRLLAVVVCLVGGLLAAAPPAAALAGVPGLVDNGNHVVGSSRIAFTMTNAGSYTIAYDGVSGDTAEPANAPAPLSLTPTTFDLIDDTSLRNTGYVSFKVLDATGTTVAQIKVTLVDDWYDGISSSIDITGQQQWAVSGIKAGSPAGTQITFVDGSCHLPDYQQNAYSIAALIVNTTPSVWTLDQDKDLTNTAYGSWDAQPPSSLMPGQCVVVSGNSADVLMGFQLNATYVTDRGLYLPFSVIVAPSTVNGGGIVINPSVFTGRPADGPTGWSGPRDNGLEISSADTSNNTDHHVRTVLSVHGAVKVQTQITQDAPPTTTSVGSPYRYQFAATPSNAQFSLANGTLPDGTMLTAGGVLAGLPTRAGSFTFAVQATGNPGVTGGSHTVVVQKGDPHLGVKVGSTDPLTLTGTIAGGATGSIDFYDDVNGGCEQSKATGAKCQGLGYGTITGGAVSVRPQLTPGQHLVHASFTGDDNHVASDSTTLTVTVPPQALATQILGGGCSGMPTGVLGTC